MTSEQKLIKGCTKGNAKYQRLLFEQYASKMLGVCARYFNSIEEAEDALQDGFVKVFSNIKNYKAEGSFEGWIRRIMVNTSLNLHRNNLKHYYHADVAEKESRIADTKLDYDYLEVEDLLGIIRSLPEGYRLVFNLYEIEGFSHKEIAEQLGISVNTSKSQLLKARRKLKAQIDKII